MKHLVSLFDIDQNELRTILSLGSQLKQLLRHGIRPPLLARTVLGLIFEKPSLRTRVSFEAGIAQLGGCGLYLGRDVGWPDRESTADFVRVLAEYVDFLVCRLNSHQAALELASYNAVPVVNGLTNLAHPCQALGDLMTLLECSPVLRGKTLAFVGDGNNVAHSLALACAMIGLRFRLLGPKNYHIKDEVIQGVLDRYPDADIHQSSNSKDILSTADFLYTDVWVSMGQETEAAERLQAFAPFQLNAELLKLAPSNCRILHCLPARRGQEITDEVIDSPNSLVIPQAGNRMHAQKGLLLWLALQQGKVSPSQLEESGIQLDPSIC